MGIPIPGKDGLYMKTWSWCQQHQTNTSPFQAHKWQAGFMEVGSLDASIALNNSLGDISSYKMSGQTWHGFIQLTWWKAAAHLEANVLQYGGVENGIDHFMISKYKWMHMNPSGCINGIIRDRDDYGNSMTANALAPLSPGHHPPSYWISSINMSFSSNKKKFNYPLSQCLDFIRNPNIFLFPYKNST